MMVQSTACAAAKPMTSDRPSFGSLASAASHAATRRIEGFRRARDVAGKNDAVGMVLCVACFRQKWNQLDVNKRR